MSRTIIPRPVTGWVIGKPIKLCYRCGKDMPHSDDGILCLACGLTTYDDEDNLENFSLFYNSSEETKK